VRGRSCRTNSQLDACCFRFDSHYQKEIIETGQLEEKTHPGGV
jgi:hypothetical protein